MRQALERYDFLEKNSRVLVAVSGGVDSLVLLSLLVKYNQRYNQHWEIHGVHINPQFPKWHIAPIKNHFEKTNVPYTIAKTNIHKQIANLTNKCYRCAHERRRKLLAVADKLSIFQIALAHHKEDVAETMLLNMIYNGAISTCTPKQSVLHGRFFFIRPLYYLDKEKIMAVARAHNLPEAKNVCPYDRASKRESVRNMLEEIRKENRAVYNSIFNSIFNIKKAYLPC